jgi:hypothetical protein
LALKRPMTIDAIAKAQAAAKVTAIRDHIRISSRTLLGCGGVCSTRSCDGAYGPICSAAMRSSRNAKTMEQMKANHGAQYEISIDGVPRPSRPPGHRASNRAAPEVQEPKLRGQDERPADRRGGRGGIQVGQLKLTDIPRGKNIVRRPATLPRTRPSTP